MLEIINSSADSVWMRGTCWSADDHVLHLKPLNLTLLMSQCSHYSDHKQVVQLLNTRVLFFIPEEIKTLPKIPNILAEFWKMCLD